MASPRWSYVDAQTFELVNDTPLDTYILYGGILAKYTGKTAGSRNYYVGTDMPYEQLRDVLADLTSGDTVYLFGGDAAGGKIFYENDGAGIGVQGQIFNPGALDISIIGIGDPIVHITDQPQALLLNACDTFYCEGVTWESDQVGSHTVEISSGTTYTFIRSNIVNAGAAGGDTGLLIDNNTATGTIANVDFFDGSIPCGGAAATAIQLIGEAATANVSSFYNLRDVVGIIDYQPAIAGDTMNFWNSEITNSDIAITGAVGGEVNIRNTRSLAGAVTLNNVAAALNVFGCDFAGAFTNTTGTPTITNSYIGGAVINTLNTATFRNTTFGATVDQNNGVMTLNNCDVVGVLTQAGGTCDKYNTTTGGIVGVVGGDEDIAGEFTTRDESLTTQNIGASPVGTCVATEYGNGRRHVTLLSLTNFVVGTIPGVGNLAVGNIIYTFPAGVHVHSVSYANLGFTIVGDNQIPVWGLGSAQGAGIVIVLNGTPTFMDYITEQTAPDTAGTPDPTGPMGATAGVLTGISLNAAGDTKTVYLNAAEAWVANNAGDLLASGTIELVWEFLE